jgi:hypothetical protein
MSAVKGRLENGKVVLAEQVDWPDGTEVRVEPVSNGDQLAPGEESQGDDPQSIARWLAWYDSLEPLILTPEEEAALKAQPAPGRGRGKLLIASDDDEYLDDCAEYMP